MCLCGGMAKKKEKPAKETKAVEGSDAGAKKKRSPLKLALFALLPLLLAGGGYAGWTFFMAGDEEAVASEGEGGHAVAEGDGHAEGQDPTHVSALPLEIKAETSFTYSYALSELLKRQCGSVRVDSLKAAAEEEARADGMLVNLSWIAANRRLGTVTEKSCEYMRAEIGNADGKAYVMAEEKAAAAKAAEGGGEAAAHH